MRHSNELISLAEVQEGKTFLSKLNGFSAGRKLFISYADEEHTQDNVWLQRQLTTIMLDFQEGGFEVFPIQKTATLTVNNHNIAEQLKNSDFILVCVTPHLCCSVKDKAAYFSSEFRLILDKKRHFPSSVKFVKLFDDIDSEPLESIDDSELYDFTDTRSYHRQLCSLFSFLLANETPTQTEGPTNNHLSYQSELEQFNLRLFHYLPTENIDFTGRQELLRNITQAFNQSASSYTALMLKGSTGVGKTQLALAFAHGAYKEKTYNTIRWIPAGSLELIEYAFLTMAEDLGINHTDYFKNARSIDEIIQSVYECLADTECLLIFDGVDSQESMATYLPNESTPYKKIHVLATSHNIHWEETLCVNPLSIKEARIFSEKILGYALPADDTDYSAFLTMLDCLPLSLRQGLFYLRQSGTNVNEYCLAYQAYQETYFPKTVNAFHHQQSVNPIAVTSQLALQKVCKFSPLAQEFIAQMALLDTANMQRSLLRQLPCMSDKDIATFSNTVHLLITYGLLERQETDYFSMHPLVHESLQIMQNHEKHKKINRLLVTIEYFLGITGDLAALKKNRKNFLLLIQHLNHLVRHYDNLVEQFGEKVVNASFFISHNNQPDLSQKTQAAVLLASLLNRLSNLYGIKGKLEEQKKRLERAVNLQKTYCGSDDFRTGMTLSNLGSVLNELGEFHSSQANLEQSLKIIEKCCQPNNVSIAVVSKNLGTMLINVGRSQRAKTLLEKALKIFSVDYNRNCLLIAITLTYIGIALRDIGDFKGSKTQLETALSIFENQEGARKTDLVTALAYLGATLIDLAETDQAKTILNRALTICQAHCGTKHPQLANVLIHLGNAVGDLGEPQQKITFVEQALEIFRKHYPENHPQVAVALKQLGEASIALGNSQEATQHLTRALAIFKIVYGVEHVQVAMTLTSLGNSIGSLGDQASHASQKQVLEQALEIFQQGHAGNNKNHPGIAVVLLSLAHVEINLNELSAAKIHAGESCQIFECYGLPAKDRAKSLLQRIDALVLSAKRSSTSAIHNNTPGLFSPASSSLTSSSPAVVPFLEEDRLINKDTQRNNCCCTIS